MALLLIFAFIAGIVTILSPCILPILPIILSTTVGGVEVGNRRAIGVITGFILSFTFFTLFLSTIVRVTGIPPDLLRQLSVLIIIIFGISLLIPNIQILIEKMFSKLANFMPKSNTDTNFTGGVWVGLSLGLLWTPCVGPILASVISLAISGAVNFSAFLITLAYSIGTAIPMFLIMIGGRGLLNKLPWLVKNTGKIQKAFGIIMILTGLAIYFNFDRNFQTFILNKFPNYGANLTKFEENIPVKKATVKLSLAPEIISGGEWFNSEPLQISDLKGKVVLIDFWTYTCINCIRTIPYVKNWHEKYKDEGLVIIGVHTPEFEFEKEAKNVSKAISDFEITYPVVQDNNFATWNNYQNRYWPAKYLIDKNGSIVYSHFGEGDYDETEKEIQKYLGITAETNNPAHANYARTPETYLGNLRRVKSKNVTFVGDWDYSAEYANPSDGASLIYNFDAKNVYLVMKQKHDSVDGSVDVYLDGVFQKTITVQDNSLYELINLPVPGIHKLELKFKDNNIEAFAFTFG
jgi:cytochrome c biogenesis protein CcdA/thiol-disulfide isomerase/thioredoxin